MSAGHVGLASAAAQKGFVVVVLPRVGNVRIGSYLLVCL